VSVDKAQNERDLLRLLNVLDGISYFEHLAAPIADNDNLSALQTGKHEDAACFQSWAMPDFMR
jgi:hypothetical protein